MQARKNVFVIHSWAEAPAYARAMDLLAEYDAGVADYSLPPWKAVPGPDDVVDEKIAERISTATVVVVLNTPGLHRRPKSSMEMQTAVGKNKRIVVLQPHGAFWRPIPDTLHGHVYRVSSWRGDVLGRAIRGEYPLEDRVFDIAEVADRRDIIALLAAGVGAFSAVVLVRDALGLSALKRESTAVGIELRWSPEDSAKVTKFALGGALLAGGITGLATKDLRSALFAAIGGGLAGAAVGVSRVYGAHLAGGGIQRVLAFAETNR